MAGDFSGAASVADGPRRCVIVDDEPGIRHFLELVAQRCGFSVEAFASVGESGGLKSEPDIVFLDLSLHQSDAVEMLRELAARDYRGAVQLMSGTYRSLLDKVRRVGENLALDMLPGLSKPFTVKAAVEVFERVRTRERVLTERSADRPSVSINLSEALQADRIDFWYQPKIDLVDGRTIGFEALARATMPDGRVVLPGAFVPGADSDALEVLTRHALNKSFEFGRELSQAGVNLPISLNIPVTALLSIDIAAAVRAQEAYSPQIVLEMTEDQIISDFDVVVAAATRLRLNAISISIDDFGHAYSSIARLKALPVSEVKIDASFVRNCASDHSNAIICQAITDLGHQFGATVCAEGIESANDLALLRSLKVDSGQGFLFAAAMPSAEALRHARAVYPVASAPSTHLATG